MTGVPEARTAGFRPDQHTAAGAQPRSTSRSDRPDQPGLTAASTGTHSRREEPRPDPAQGHRDAALLVATMTDLLDREEPLKPRIDTKINITYTEDLTSSGDPTVSRTLTALAQDADQALAAIDTARAQARARVWALAKDRAPNHGRDGGAPLVVDLGATLVTAHSEKEQAAPTFKHGFGFHPLCAFVDHGAEGTAEPLAIHLRAGNAGSNTAAYHITVTKAALRQLPGHRTGTRPGRKVLIRTDGAGATHAFLDWTQWATVVVLGRVHPDR